MKFSLGRRREVSLFGRYRRVRFFVVSSVASVLVMVVLIAGTAWWLQKASDGHIFDADDAPIAPVVIIPGAQVRDGYPAGYLRGRLESSLTLLRDRKVRAVLVSGDAEGNSGDEIAAMTTFLIDNGVDPRIIIADPYGLSTYETCARARQTFSVTKAIIVSQPLQLRRAVALCRSVGIDADGVTAECHCPSGMEFKNNLREWIVGPKALLNIIFDTGPKRISQPDGTLGDLIEER
ncbi:MAG: SanA/YdcF family protein [Mycobacteriaceae bacterium]